MVSWAERLCQVYTLLRGHFGYAPRWWPGEPVEVAVTAILVQQCDWSVAWNAAGRLRAHGLLSLPRLASARPLHVCRRIRGVAFAPTKSRRLVRLAETLCARGHERIETFLDPTRDTAALRREVLRLEGVGEETADAFLLFASTHSTFLVDAYTRRIFHRLGLDPHGDDGFWSAPYPRLRAFFETTLRASLPLYDGFTFDPGVPREVALFRDFHAQLVELGKHHCLRTRPRCRLPGKSGWAEYPVCSTHCPGNACTACPLASICRSARADSAPGAF